MARLQTALPSSNVPVAQVADGAALEALPSIRKPMVRIRPGSIRCEMEGAMGSIHEVSLQIRTLPQRDWPTLIRVLRRSKTIIEALENGRVPRSFDRLVARIVGEPLFPDARSVTFGCSCDLPEKPCRHVLALHELFARRLDEKPYEILQLRGVDLHATLAKASGMVFGVQALVVIGLWHLAAAGALPLPFIENGTMTAISSTAVPITRYMIDEEEFVCLEFSAMGDFLIDC